MENIKEITDSFGNLHIVIYSSETEFESMPKAEYERRQAEQSKEN
jgi:hypothetical protein